MAAHVFRHNSPNRNDRKSKIMLKHHLAGSLALATMLCLAAAPQAFGGDVNKAPKSYLLGSSTGISSPSGMAVDAAGNRYVANLPNTSITIYPASASGNAAPTRTIGGPNTTLVGPRSVMVDKDGRIYVGDLLGAGTNKVAVFAPNANGNVAPERVITGSNTLLEWPSGLSLDSVGRLYVANRVNSTVTVYAPGSDGNTGPLRVITGAATGLDEPFGLVVTSGNILHVANNGSGSVTSYASGASGNAAPIRTISGAATGFTSPGGIAADSFDNLYVTNTAVPYSVSVFGSGASGNVAPITRLVGPETDMGVSFAVAVTAARDVVVAQYQGDVVTTYSPLVAPPSPPSVVRSLAVSGKASSAVRTVSWRAPALSGGGPVLSYHISVKSNGKTILTKTLSAAKLKLAIQKEKLRKGKSTITVQARNQYGLSPKKSVIAVVVSG
jgi:serine/threonine protein kinase, bacterial